MGGLRAGDKDNLEGQRFIISGFSITEVAVIESVMQLGGVNL